MTRSIFGSDAHAAPFDKKDYALNSWMGGRKYDKAPYPKPKLLSHKTVVFADAKFGINSAGQFYPWDYFHLGVDGNGYLPWPWDENLGIKPEARGHPKCRANFVFGDGHVESLVLRDYVDLPKDLRKVFSGAP